MLQRSIQRVRSRLAKLAQRRFRGSVRYWDERYASGGNSGAGSYDRLAEFKADYLNNFVVRHNVGSVIEFGSGDGNQLRLIHYPSYFGVDVSPAAIARCRAMFASDGTKAFAASAPESKFDLSLSLDVIYHLVEDDIFHAYMAELFKSSDRFVVIYSSNIEQDDFYSIYKEDPVDHVRHRKFTGWVDKFAREWRLIDQTSNKYPYNENDKRNTSFADFYAYERSK